MVPTLGDGGVAVEAVPIGFAAPAFDEEVVVHLSALRADADAEVSGAGASG